MLDKRLFGTRGIRGPVSTKVTPELMLRIGGALAEYVDGGDVVVGRDTRTSGEMLSRAFIAGLISGGSDVVEIGVAPSPVNSYLAAIKKLVKVKGGLKVVIDCANGAASPVTPRLLRELGCRVVTLNAHPDGHFPGRRPETQPWNLLDLMYAVREVNADIGLAHDGDADRIAVIDEQGNFVKHDSVIALFAGLAVENSPGGTVVTSINTSVAIDEVVARAGGKTVRTALGGFTEAMLEHNACFAAEPGKLVFLDHGPWADGVIAAAKLVELVSSKGEPISKIIADSVPDYPMYSQDFECPDDIKEDFMREVRTHLLANLDEIQESVDIDGLRVNRNNGSWVLIRVSGTEPKARFVVEGRDQAELERLRTIGLDKIGQMLRPIQT